MKGADIQAVASVSSVTWWLSSKASYSLDSAVSRSKALIVARSGSFQGAASGPAVLVGQAPTHALFSTLENLSADRISRKLAHTSLRYQDVFFSGL